MWGHNGNVAGGPRRHHLGRAPPALLVRLAPALQAFARAPVWSSANHSRAAQTDARLLSGAKSSCDARLHSQLYPVDPSPTVYSAQIVTRAESVFKIAMPESVAELLNFFDSLNLSIDALQGIIGLELQCLSLGSFSGFTEVTAIPAV